MRTTGWRSTSQKLTSLYLCSFPVVSICGHWWLFLSIVLLALLLDQFSSSLVQLPFWCHVQICWKWCGLVAELGWGENEKCKYANWHWDIWWFLLCCVPYLQYSSSYNKMIGSVSRIGRKSFICISIMVSKLLTFLYKVPGLNIITFPTQSSTQYHYTVLVPGTIGKMQY